MSVASLRVYVGTRSLGADHIHCLSLDRNSGALSEAAVPQAVDKPSFVALHPQGGTLYAVNELGDSRSQCYGAVSSFAIDQAAGGLSFLNQRETGGAAPCQVSIARDGRRLFVANYWGGSVASFALETDGRLGPMIAFVQHEGGARGPGRDPGPHAHWTSAGEDGRYLYVTDLGRDELLVYPMDEAGLFDASTAAVFRFPDGTGPRHAVFVGGGKLCAVVGELASNVTLFDHDAIYGRLTKPRVLPTLPVGWTGENAAAEIAATPNERFLYISNRGHDSIAIFRIDPEFGRLIPSGFSSACGRTPRHFAIDPAGRLLVVANQGSNNLAVLSIDAATGQLRSTGKSYAVTAPTCVVIAVPGGAKREANA